MAKNKQAVDLKEFIGKIGQVNARLRILEEKINQIRDKVEVIDQTMIENKKNFQEEFKDTNLRIDELFKELDDTKTAVRQVIKQLQTFASKRDVKVLQKYMDLFDPTLFMQREEIEELIKKKINELKGK